MDKMVLLVISNDDSEVDNVLQIDALYFIVVNVAPELQTCRLGVQNSGGEVRNSTSVGPCLQEKANYMKFQPAKFSFEFTFSSAVNVSTPKPLHISEYQFGIVNSSIRLSKRNTLGNYTVQIVYLYIQHF
jgi:hypothetical protein